MHRCKGRTALSWDSTSLWSHLLPSPRPSWHHRASAGDPSSVLQTLSVPRRHARRSLPGQAGLLLSGHFVGAAPTELGVPRVRSSALRAGQPRGLRPGHRTQQAAQWARGAQVQRGLQAVRGRGPRARPSASGTRCISAAWDSALHCTVQYFTVFRDSKYCTSKLLGSPKIRFGLTVCTLSLSHKNSVLTLQFNLNALGRQRDMCQTTRPGLTL